MGSVVVCTLSDCIEPETAIVGSQRPFSSDSEAEGVGRGVEARCPPLTRSSDIVVHALAKVFWRESKVVVRFDGKSVCTRKEAFPGAQADESIVYDHEGSVTLANAGNVAHHLVAFEVELPDGLATDSGDIGLVDDVEEHDVSVFRSRDGLGQDSNNIECSLSVDNAHDAVHAGWAMDQYKLWQSLKLTHKPTP